MKVLRNVLAVVLGIFLGGVVNMFIVMKGALPIGVTIDNLAENIHLLEAKHFVLPILGHATGTLVGAFIAGFVATSNKMKFAIGIGVFSLICGISNIIILNFPLIPAIVDLLIAYIPMGFIGGRIALKFNKEKA